MSRMQMLAALAMFGAMVFLMIWSGGGEEPVRPAAVRDASEGSGAVASAPRRLPPVHVVKALDDIPRYSVVRSWMVTEVPTIPEDEEAAKRLTEISPRLDEVVGKVSMRFIEKGELVTRDSVAERSRVPELTYHIKPGHRAITIGVDVNEGALGGFLRPGDMVDVLATYG